MSMSADIAGNRAELSFVLSTPVWGLNHIGLFLAVGLPSLMAESNLPGLVAAVQCRYRIYTRAEDRAQIESDPGFARLAQLLTVEIKEIVSDAESPHRTMSDCHIDTMALADQLAAAAVFVPPDCIWADGSLMKLLAIARGGKSVVHMSGIRLDRDSVMPELTRRLSDDGHVLKVQSRELVAIGVNHLHPIAYSHFWNEYDGELMPANLMWTVQDEGLLLRCFHLHPLMVKSQVPFAKFSSTIDDDLVLHACPDVSGDHVVTDSDEILAFELSGLDRVVGTVCAKGAVEGAAAWAESGTNARHRELIKQSIRIHSAQPTEALWAARIAESEKVVQEITDLNTLSTSELVGGGHLQVLTGRLIAASFGRGEVSQALPLWAKIAFGVREALETVSRRCNKFLFWKDGRVRITHPAWLLVRSSMSTISDCLGAGDRTLVVVGAESALIAEIKHARPDLQVIAVNATNIPSSAINSLKRAFPVVVAPVVEGDNPPPVLLKLADAGLRCYLLRPGPPPRHGANAYKAVQIGSAGVRLTGFLNAQWRRLKAQRAAMRGPARVAFHGFVLLFSVIFQAIGAALCLVLNTAGLALDGLTRSARSAERLRAQTVAILGKGRR
jgi:hypothetical protein